jgi:enoyl-CoA hydratase/carnithine racemase
MSTRDDSAAALICDVSGGVAVLTLNRPDKLNALTPMMMSALGAALDAIDADPDVRAVVITGAGTRAFTAGFDLDGLEMADRTDAIVDSTRGNFEILMKIWNLRVPSIAAVNGFAVAAGMSLALICEMTIASTNASFGEPEVRHFALAPLLLLPWFANNPKFANYLYYTGDTISAARAHDLGLVSEVVPADDLLDRAIAIARRIAMVPRFAVEMTKESIRRSYEIMGFSSALQQHRLLDTLLLSAHGIPERDHFFALMASGDMRAFLAARDGKFNNPPAGGNP